MQDSNTALFSHFRENEHLSDHLGIDWITVRQDHAGDLPRLGGDLQVSYELDTGAVRYETVTRLTHRGSFDDSLGVRCDGCTVEVSGNPSRWGAPHNLQMCVSVQAGIDVFNGVLRDLGLPEFTAGKMRPAQGTGRGDNRDPFVVIGPRLSRVDVCAQYATGDARAARAYLRAQCAVAHRGKPGQLTANGSAVLWGYGGVHGKGSRRVSAKQYLKGPEMRAHRTCPELVEAVEGAGIIRHEVTLRGMWLADKGLASPSAWTNRAMAEIIELYPGRAVGLGRGGLQAVADHLQSAGHSPATAARGQAFALAWATGEDLRAELSKSSYYRLRSLLLDAGIDIAAPLDVSALPPVVESVTLSPGLGALRPAA